MEPLTKQVTNVTTRKTTKPKPKAQSKVAASKRKAAQKPAAKKQTVKHPKNSPKKTPPKKKAPPRRKATSGSWVKGQSGNPGGRPKKGNAWTDIFNEVMEAKSAHVVMNTPDAEGKLKRTEININAVGTKRNIRQLVALKIVDQALKGDTTAQKIIIEHEVGRPMQMNVNANMTPDDLPDLKKGEDPIAKLLEQFSQRK